MICELTRGGIDDQSTDLLEDALKARNFLAHHFFNWHSEDFITPEGRGRMLKELEQLRYRIGRARIVFGQIREHFYEHVFGISAAEAQKLYEKYLRTHRNVVGFEPS